MLSNWLNWAIDFAARKASGPKAFFWESVYPFVRPRIKWCVEFIAPPWNIPLIAGLGFLGLGLMFMMLSIKAPWYKIPTHLYPAPVIDQADVLPTKRKPRVLTADSKNSQFEFPAKGIVVLSLCAAGIYIVRSKWSAESRAHALGTVSAIGLTTGLAFCHLVIIDEPELSHMAAWIYSQHDGLAWYGGDIYTSREYEVPGGAYDILMKDPPKFLAVVSPPYIDFDLATINDFLTWAGLCFAFWVFMGKGWANLMLGALLLLLGVLCTRKPNQTRGLSADIVQWVLIRTGLIITPWILIVTTRAMLVAMTVTSAQTAYEQGDIAASLKAMRGYRTYMPCLEYDSGLMLQEGILEYTLGHQTDRALFAKAFMLESNGDPTRAEALYRQLMDSELECVARESARYIFRRAIINYNAGEESVALELLEDFKARYPCMPKASYLRLLIAVRANDFPVAQRSLQEIYAVTRSIGIPEARGYCTSGHQHLAQLAFDMGDITEARRQVVYRMEQQPK